MDALFDAVKFGDLERVTLLVEQGIDQNQKIAGGIMEGAVFFAAQSNHLNVLRYLVEQGTSMEWTSAMGWTPLHIASALGLVEVTQYLLEQGANRDKTDVFGDTPLHNAADGAQLETAKLLMLYGADLNAKNIRGLLPIDMTDSEEVKQAIRDETRRRMDEAPGKRAFEQDRQPNATAASASAQSEEEAEEEVKDEQSKKRPRHEEGDEAKAEQNKVTDEDEDSEPSDGEDDCKD